MTIYAESKTSDGDLRNIYMKKGSFKDFQITYAKKGKYNLINGVNFLTLYDGNTIYNTNNGISNFSFSKSDFNLSDLDTNTITAIKTQETSTMKLLSCIKSYNNGKLGIENNPAITLNCNLRNIDNVFKELYKRHIIPIYIPILIMISLIHVIIPKEKINYTKYRSFIFLSGLFLIIFSETTLRFISNELIFNLNMITIPIIIFIVLYFSIFIKLKTKIKKN